MRTLFCLEHVRTRTPRGGEKNQRRSFVTQDVIFPCASVLTKCRTASSQNICQHGGIGETQGLNLPPKTRERAKHPPHAGRDHLRHGVSAN